MKSEVIPFIAGALLAGVVTVTFAVRKQLVSSKPMPTAAQPEAPENGPQHAVLAASVVSFRWSSIETEDLAQLEANLHLIGCPEQTIWDIVKARLDYLYQERARKMHNPMARHWSNREAVQKDAEAVGALWAEHDLAARKLGVPVEPRFSPNAPTKTSQLPTEKLAQIEHINHLYPRRFLSATATAEEVEQEFSNRKARLDHLAQYLTPEELTDYRLEQDSSVKTVAALLGPISLSPEELNKVAFALDFAQARIVSGHLPPEVERTLRENLGPERYKEYVDAFSQKNVRYTQFFISDQTTPEEILELKVIRSRNLAPEALKAAVTEVIGPRRAAQYLAMTGVKR